MNLMTETENSIEHLDWRPCESPSHARADDGCEAGGDAKWVIVLTHPLSPVHAAKTEPRQMLVCDGRVIWLRGRMHNTINCKGCGKTAPLSEYIKIIGPIEQPTGATSS